MSEERRIELGDRLRALREAAGHSGKSLADMMSWQASKLSRIENGRQRVSDSDIQEIAEALGLDAETAQELRGDLRSIRAEEARFSRRIRVGGGHGAIQREVAERDRQTREIRGFSPLLIPGLLQTADYARAVFADLADLRETTDDPDDGVAGRMDRQQVIYSARTVHLITTELALRNPVASPDVMHAQIDRLLAVQGLSTLRLGIIPLGVRIPVVSHGFTIRDTSTVVELSHTDTDTSESDDMALYSKLFARLAAASVEDNDARKLLLKLSRT